MKLRHNLNTSMKSVLSTGLKMMSVKQCFLALFLLTLSLNFMPSLSHAQGIHDSDAEWAVQSDLKASAPEQRFKALFGRVQGFAGILLLIGCVLGAIFFLMGNTKMAILVFGGAVIVYGGGYIVGIAAKSFGT